MKKIILLTGVILSLFSFTEPIKKESKPEESKTIRPTLVCHTYESSQGAMAYLGHQMWIQAMEAAYPQMGEYSYWACGSPAQGCRVEEVCYCTSGCLIAD
jgi:hypothetical protein